jgi:hypothetical protein
LFGSLKVERCTVSTLKHVAKAKRKPSTGCTGITKPDCTRR